MSNSTWRFVPPARDVASEGGPSGETCLFRGKTNRLDIKIELDLAKQSHQGNIVLVRCELVTWVGFITLNAKKLNQIRTNFQFSFNPSQTAVLPNSLETNYTGFKLSPLTLIRFSSSSDGSVESKSPSMTNCGTPRLRQ